jgi:hypothetical protein
MKSARRQVASPVPAMPPDVGIRHTIHGKRERYGERIDSMERHRPWHDRFPSFRIADSTSSGQNDPAGHAGGIAWFDEIGAWAARRLSARA